MAARKRAITMAFSNGKAFEILIFSLNKKRNNFLNTGEFLKQEYQIDLQVIGGSKWEKLFQKMEKD